MPQEPHSVSDTLDGLEKLADNQGRVAFGDVLGAFGHRSFGPFFLVFGLLELSPVGESRECLPCLRPFASSLRCNLPLPESTSGFQGLSSGAR